MAAPPTATLSPSSVWRGSQGAGAQSSPRQLTKAMHLTATQYDSRPENVGAVPDITMKTGAAPVSFYTRLDGTLTHDSPACDV